MSDKVGLQWRCVGLAVCQCVSNSIHMLHSMCQCAYKRCVLLKAVDLQASAADLSHEKGAHECFINSNGSVIPLAAKEKENIPLK